MGLLINIAFFVIAVVAVAVAITFATLGLMGHRKSRAPDSPQEPVWRLPREPGWQNQAVRWIEDADK